MLHRWGLFSTFMLGAARLAAAPAASLVLSPAEQAWVAAHPVIRIQMAKASAPFEYRDPDGTPRGLSYDTLKLACGRLGLGIKVTDLSWPVAVAAIQAPQPPVDLLLGVTASDERRRQMLLTRTYTSFPYVIFTTKSHPFISGMGDLLHATVAVEQDDVMEDWLRRDLPDARILVLDQNSQVLQAVSEGRADAYVGNLAIGSYTVERLGYVNLKVAAPAPYGFDSYSFGVRRDWPQLVGLLDKALASISPEEEAALRLRWLQVRYDYGLRWRDLLLWLGLGAAVAAAFIVQLRRMVRRRTAELGAEVRRRRDAEQGLRQSLTREQELRQHLADILDFLPDATVVLDRDHKVQAWNRAMERLSGLPKAAVMGRGREAYAPPFYGAPQPFLADYVLDGQPPQGYTLLQRQGPVHMAQRLVPGLRGGRGAWLYATAAALQDADGQLLGAIESIRDVTEQKALEAQLAQSQRLEAIGTLAAGIAHDFNNILGAAGGYAELALARAQDPALREDLQGIARATARAAELVRQILAFSRVTPEAPRPLLPGPLVAEAMALLRATIPAGVSLSAHLDSQAMVLADPAEIHRVVVNLCANAAAATRGEGSLRVSLEDVQPDAALRAALPALGPGRQVRLRVEDDGAGMAPEVMARIFEPFYTTRPDAGGTGMGLAVVHGIVSSRGGAIQVDSAPGAGSRFSVYLPALPDAAPPLAAPGSAPGTEAAPGPAAARGRLLLVDDEPELLNVLSRSLQRLGWTVEAFSEPKRALERLRADPPAFVAVVTDRSMPGMGGAALAAEAKALAPSLPVLLCTGYDDGGVAPGGSVDRVLQKPVNVAELDAELRGLAERIDPPPPRP